MSSNVDGIRVLDYRDHIRLRPSMYIANTGGGESMDDGVYSLFKEVVENATDEFNAGFGCVLEIECDEKHFTVRDFGRGIPLEALQRVCEIPHAGGKFSSDIYINSAGLHGLGLKVVRHLCCKLNIRSIRSGKFRELRYANGQLVDDISGDTSEPTGTLVEAHPDPMIFPELKLKQTCLNDIVTRYLAANPGLEIVLNSCKLPKLNGMADFLARQLDLTKTSGLLVSACCDGIELAFAQNRFAPGWWCSFVNGHCTGNGGIHADAAKAALVASSRRWWKDGCNGKTLDSRDVLYGMCGAVSVRIAAPSFEGQTKNRLNNVAKFRCWVDRLTKKISDHWFTHPDECELFFRQIEYNVECRQRHEKAIHDTHEKDALQSHEVGNEKTNVNPTQN